MDGLKISSQPGSTCAGSVPLSKAKRSRSTPQLVSTRAELYSNTATIPFLGTMSNAEIRIRTPYPAAPCGSVTKIALKDLEKYDPRDAGALRAGFSLILGLDWSDFPVPLRVSLGNDVQIMLKHDCSVSA